MALLVAVAPGRSVGEVWPRLRALAVDAAERIFPPAMLYRSRCRRGAGARCDQQDGGGVFRRVERLPAFRRRLPGGDAAVLRVGAEPGGAPADPVGQLRAAVQDRNARYTADP